LRLGRILYLRHSMTHAENKVEWCLKKAKNELHADGKHRGLVSVTPDIVRAMRHIAKAEHYLTASNYLHGGNFSDISASTLFYSVYHCFLAIALKFGYESRNQECTFALITKLIADNKIDFDPQMLVKIVSFDSEQEKTILQLREQYQYGVDLTIQDNLYQELLHLAQDVLLKTKTIIQS